MTDFVVAEGIYDLRQGRVGVVTGAAQGIGFAIARTLSTHGAALVIADIDGEAAEKAAVAIAETGRIASAVATDVAQERHIQHAVDNAVQTHGRLDVFVKNAV